MVAQHYRWDFIGLSTDQKPTPATSEKVVDGSTFYCSDNSKLYVYCKDQWYEKTATGGGASYTAGDGISIADDTISVDPTYVATMAELDARINKGAGTPTTATEGVVGGLYEDTTNGKLYICTAVTEGTDPDPDTYTWSEVGGSSVTVVQTAGNSATDVMSQNATTSMVFADPESQTKIKIGSGASSTIGNNAIEIGRNSSAAYNNTIAIGGGNISTFAAHADALGAVAIGNSSSVSGQRGLAIGEGAKVHGDYSAVLGAYSLVDTNSKGCVALGSGSKVNSNLVGVIQVGVSNPDFSNPTNYGYNNTIYRLITGVYDGQGLHDAATVAQGNTLASSAPTTSTVGVLGQLYTNTTDGKIYHCTAIDTTDPNNPSYTWSEVGAGGGGGGVTFLTSSDYNYPDVNPDGFAVWKFPQGEYFFPTGCAIYYDSDGTTSPLSSASNTHGGSFTISCVGTDLVKYTILNDAHFALGITALPSGASSGFYEISAS